MNKRVSFKPLRHDAIALLQWATGFDYAGVDFGNDDFWFCCTVFDDDRPVIVIVFEFKTPFDAHLTLAVADARGLTRHLITAIYQTVFQRASRVTALIRPIDARACKQAIRMGFRQEGVLRRGYDGMHDAVLWGLLPEECPYIRGIPFTYRRVDIKPTHAVAERIQ